MSPPMVCGAEAPFVLRWALRTLDAGRGYRAPLSVCLPKSSAPEQAEIAVALISHVDEKTLGKVSLALTALENYYIAIGAKWDAQRMSDQRWPIDIILDRARWRAEDDAAARAGSIWDAAFRSALSK